LKNKHLLKTFKRTITSIGLKQDCSQADGEKNLNFISSRIKIYQNILFWKKFDVYGHICCTFWWL